MFYKKNMLPIHTFIPINFHLPFFTSGYRIFNLLSEHLFLALKYLFTVLLSVWSHGIWHLWRKHLYIKHFTTWALCIFGSTWRWRNTLVDVHLYFSRLLHSSTLKLIAWMLKTFDHCAFNLFRDTLRKTIAQSFLLVKPISKRTLSRKDT